MLTFPAQSEHHRSLVLEPVGSGILGRTTPLRGFLDGPQPHARPKRLESVTTRAIDQPGSSSSSGRAGGLVVRVLTKDRDRGSGERVALRPTLVAVQAEDAQVRGVVASAVLALDDVSTYGRETGGFPA
jgi:hypothetical protein